MKKFNEKEFVNLVRNYRKEIKFTTSDSQVKHEIAHICMDKGYDCADIILFIYDAWERTYPHFERPFMSRSWKGIIEHYIKEAENEYDWKLAKRLSEILDNSTGSKNEKEGYYRSRFFNIRSEEGIDTTIIEMDMCIDHCGWIKTLDLIISLSEKESVKHGTVETEERIYSSEVDKRKSAEEPIIKTTSTESRDLKRVSSTTDAPIAITGEKKKKTRRRIKYIEIHKLTLDGVFIESFRSIGEAAKSGNYNHASISKCVSGIYKTAEGFRWVGITDKTNEIKDAA